jgi:hypothetical protein
MAAAYSELKAEGNSRFNGCRLSTFGSIRVVEVLGNNSTTNAKEDEVGMSSQTTQSGIFLIDCSCVRVDERVQSIEDKRQPNI